MISCTNSRWPLHPGPSNFGILTQQFLCPQKMNALLRLRWERLSGKFWLASERDRFHGGRMVGNTEVSPVSTKQSVAEDCAFLCGQLANFGNPGKPGQLRIQ